jgi:hypothetical protein
MAGSHSTGRWGRHIDGIMSEIVREASICRVRLLDPGVIDAVMRDDASVCGSDNPKAFLKLKQLLQMGFFVRESAFEKLGPVEAEAMIEAVRETLKARFGDRLGG